MCTMFWKQWKKERKKKCAEDVCARAIERNKSKQRTFKQNVKPKWIIYGIKITELFCSLCLVGWLVNAGVEVVGLNVKSEETTHTTHLK